MPRLPRKVEVHVAKCHACHAKCRKCHACHAKWRSMSPSATPATQSDALCRQVPQTAAASTASTGNQARHQSKPSAISATPATQSDARCRQVPRLPRKVTLDVAKCHTCHAKWRSMSPSATPSMQTAAASTAPTGNQACHQSQPSAISATPATQSGGPCRQMPRLPRKVTLDVAKCHACHANSGGVHGANWEPSAPPEPAPCHKCHACHAKWRSMSPSATPATQSDARCRQVPRRPRKVKVDVTKSAPVEKLSVDKYVEELCVDKLWRFVCGEVVCASCVDKLWVDGEVVCGEVVCGGVVWISCV